MLNFIIKDNNNQILSLKELDKEIYKLWNQPYNEKSYAFPIQNVKTTLKDVTLETVDFKLTNNYTWVKKFAYAISKIIIKNNNRHIKIDEIANRLLDPFILYNGKLFYFPNTINNICPYIQILEYLLNKGYTIYKN